MSLNENQGIAGQETAPQRSLDLWREIPISEVFFNPGKGHCVMERFVNANVYASATVAGGVKTYQDSSATVQGIKYLGGALRMATPATDNKEAHYQLGGGVGAAFSINSAAFRSLCHEVCLRLNTVVETGFYFGLGEEDFALENALVDDTGALVSKDFIGFHMPAHASTGKLSFVYRKAGQAMTVIAADVLTVTAAQLFTGGFYFEKRTKKLTGYINGVAVGELAYPNWGTGLFPDGELLSPCRGIKGGEAVIKSADIVWADTAALSA